MSAKYDFATATEHLLRGFRRRKMLHHIWVLGLHEPNPCRAAGGEERIPIWLFIIEFPAYKFVAFFNNCQVGGKIGIKDIVKANFAQGGDETLDRREFPRYAKILSPGGADSRRDLNDCDDIGIGPRAISLHGIVAFAQRACRTMVVKHCPQRTQSRLVDLPVARDPLHCPGAGIIRPHDADGLNLIADLDTTSCT